MKHMSKKDLLKDAVPVKGSMSFTIGGETISTTKVYVGPNNVLAGVTDDPGGQETVLGMRFSTLKKPGKYDIDENVLIGAYPHGGNSTSVVRGTLSLKEIDVDELRYNGGFEGFTEDGISAEGKFEMRRM